MRPVIVFAGCSYTAGHGWHDDAGLSCTNHPDLWCNIVAKALGLQAKNYGQGGGSNRDIFRNTVAAVAEHGSQIDRIIVQWTSMPRYRFELGIEDWPTHETLQNRNRTDDVGLAGLLVPRHKIDSIIDSFLALHNLHYEICDLIAMINTLTKLAGLISAEIYYVNGLCPWDQDYFTHRIDTHRQPKDLTKFTQDSILNTESRTDEQIFRLYDRIHDNYTHLGTIQAENWINLYQSFKNLQQDTNLDHQHPGILSNISYANLVLRHFTN
jgi:hypothetical protein